MVIPAHREGGQNEETLAVAERLVQEEIQRVDGRLRDIIRVSRIGDITTHRPRDGNPELAEGLRTFLRSIEDARSNGRTRLNWTDARVLLRANALYGNLLSRSMRTFLKTLKRCHNETIGPFPRSQEFFFQN
jgi:hypothetical protein